MAKQDEPMEAAPSIFEQTLTLDLAGLQPELRVLIVDDDPDARDYLVAVVQEAGYLTAVASSGEEALQLLEREFCPILISDRNMPGMDGLTLCKRARQGTYPGYLYIFLLTAHNATEDIVTGLKAGADDYLGKKNISPPELVARLGNARRIINLEQALRRALDQKRQMANTDVLTGAYSRRYLERQLSQELERTRRFNHPLSVLLVDIDHFKRVNDRFGHAMGDEVLRNTYRRMRELLPRACDWIARYGGEEFLVVLLDTDLGGAEVVAQRLNAGLAGVHDQHIQRRGCRDHQHRRRGRVADAVEQPDFHRPVADRGSMPVREQTQRSQPLHHASRRRVADRAARGEASR